MNNEHDEKNNPAPKVSFESDSDSDTDADSKN